VPLAYAFAMSRRTDSYVQRAAAAAGIGVLAVALALAVWAASHVLLLIFGGVLLAVLLRALAATLSERSGLSVRWSLIVVVLALAAVLGSAGWYLSAELYGQFDELGRSLASTWRQICMRLEQNAWGRHIASMISAQQTSPERIDLFGKLFAGILSGVAGLVLSVFIALYLAADPPLYRRGLLRLVPVRVRNRAADVLDDLEHTLRSWLLGTLLVMVVVGTAVTTGLWLLGVPLALALGLIAFVLEFIPYIGPIVAAVPAVLVASAIGTREVMLVVLLYWAIQTIEGYVLSPLVYQRRVHIPPVLTISAQVLLGTLFGVLGVIFATPLTACALVLTQRLYVEDTLGDRLDNAVRDR
jgi:predicted PurR-regulated permease PerM